MYKYERITRPEVMWTVKIDFTDFEPKKGRQKGSQRGECWILILIWRFRMTLWLYCLVTGE